MVGAARPRAAPRAALRTAPRAALRTVRVGRLPRSEIRTRPAHDRRYAVDAEVGYYVQVAGLGRRPEDVIIGGERGIYVDAMDPEQATVGRVDVLVLQ